MVSWNVCFLLSEAIAWERKEGLENSERPPHISDCEGIWWYGICKCQNFDGFPLNRRSRHQMHSARGENITVPEWMSFLPFAKTSLRTFLQLRPKAVRTSNRPHCKFKTASVIFPNPAAKKMLAPLSLSPLFFFRPHTVPCTI